MTKKMFLLICILITLILFGSNQSYASSELDNYTWQKLDEYITGRDIYSVCCNGEGFVAVGQKGLILKSRDGIKWEKCSICYEEDFYKIVWDGVKYTATTKSGRMFTSENANNWGLSSKKNQLIKVSEIKAVSQKYTFGSKLYGFVNDGKNAAVAVGEAGNIYYGTQKGKTGLFKEKLAFRPYYREYLKRLGNSAVLYAGSSRLYSDNHIKKDVPAPYIETISKQKVVYVPAESLLKSIGGSFQYNGNTALAEMKIGNNNVKFAADKKVITVNGKNVNVPYPAKLKNKVLYIPLDDIKFLGKKAYITGKLIVISDFDNIFNSSEDAKIIEALAKIFNNASYQQQSLSESVLNSLVTIGKGKQKEGYLVDAENYFEQANDIEKGSDVYIHLVELNQQKDDYTKARLNASYGLDLNCESFVLYTDLMYIYCDMCWYEKATESINKAVSLNPNSIDFRKPFAYLDSCKGKTEKVKEITVSNYSELEKAIGSNRKITLLPGNYKRKPSEAEEISISNVKNLTISGAPEKGKNYVDLEQGSSIFKFQGCSNINISNLNLNDSFVFSNCSNILINNCSTKVKESYGISSKNVYNLACEDSYIESTDGIGIIEIDASENINFRGCTMKGYTLQIDDSYDTSLNKNIVLKNCSLLGKAGIRSTWSNYVPIKDNSVYELFLGTEGWNERRFLSAIKYNTINKYSYQDSLTYENTYDGNEEIFNDGKFLKLAEKMNSVMNGMAFPSVDYIVGENEDYNAYYDFYGTPKLKKLNINLFADATSNANIGSMFDMIKKLKPIENDIFAYSWPVTVIYRDQTKYRNVIAVAEFSNEAFRKYLDNGSNAELEKYCTVLLPAKFLDDTDISAKNFFNIDAKASEASITEDISGTLLTKTIKFEDPDFAQKNTMLYTAKSQDGYYYVSALESFIGQGDFMHYSTDMIVKTNAITGDRYIAADGDTYKLLDNKTNAAKVSVYKKVIFEQLNSSAKLKKLISGSPCSDVLVFVENNNMDKNISFVFLTALKSNDAVQGNGDSIYTFKYYVGTLDTDSKKVIDAKYIKLVEYNR